MRPPRCISVVPSLSCMTLNDFVKLSGAWSPPLYKERTTLELRLVGRSEDHRHVCGVVLGVGECCLLVINQELKAGVILASTSWEGGPFVLIH